MIKLAEFKISKRPYAVALDTYQVKASKLTYADGSTGTEFYRMSVYAAWFRRRSGTTVACVGSLHTGKRADRFPDGLPDVHAFLVGFTDGRYGGDCYGRWDGTSYWGIDGLLDRQERNLAILKPMLANYPAIPAGYDGWYSFVAEPR